MNPGVQFGDWAFERSGGLCRLRGANGLVFAASASTAGTGIGGVDALGVPDAPAPPMTNAQFMRLRFRSNGFFRAEPQAHLALGVAGTWRKSDPASSQRTGMIAGRGLIIGNVSGAANGCADAPVVQIESFRTNGNALFPGTCSPRLDDGTWYTIEFSASNEGRIAYRLHDTSGNLLTQTEVLDSTPDVPPDLAGWWILHAYSDRHLEQDWTFEITGLEVGWRGT